MSLRAERLHFTANFSVIAVLACWHPNPNDSNRTVLNNQGFPTYASTNVALGIRSTLKDLIYLLAVVHLKALML